MPPYVIGVDEAGRGPLAGPVAVGAVFVPAGFDWGVLPGVNDSKKLSEEKRHIIFEHARTLRLKGIIDFQVALVGARAIDTIGIAPSVRRGIERTVRALESRHKFMPTEVTVLLDGALRAPVRFVNQKTIIGGDGKEKCIGLASILAKVTRDRLMVRLAKHYPAYGFEIHKGYGTKRHRSGIIEHGLSDIHRRTFCRRLTNQDRLVR